MPDRLPLLRVDHVSIAVREMGPALAFFRRVLPIRMREAPRPGYDGQFTWADFFVGDRKLELIESARPESFVEQFIARRGEGFHHLSPRRAVNCSTKLSGRAEIGRAHV